MPSFAQRADAYPVLRSHEPCPTTPPPQCKRGLPSARRVLRVVVSKSKLLYLVTEPWYFASHRLDHALALQEAGFEVHVATRRGARWEELVEAGCVLHEIDIGRGLGSTRSWLREIRALRKVIRRARPDLVHAVALKPVALALSLLGKRRRPALILSVNGLGMSAASGGRRLALIRGVINSVRRLPRVHLLFQTRADQHAVVGCETVGVVVPGVGVDTGRFRPAARSATPPLTVVFLGRAIRAKGLLDLAAACEEEIPGVEVNLYCIVDSASPGALGSEELQRLERPPAISLHPATLDPEGVLGRAHAAILPSHAGEGVSKFVLEALASGTPVLLSGESGSGEVIEPGRTGVVFKAADPASIRAALLEVACWSADRWAEASAACRSAAEREFSLDVILPRIVELHRAALGNRSSP